MPITRSAKKAHRASQRKRSFNLERKDRVSKAVKTVKKLIAEGKKSEAATEMSKVQKVLDKAVKMNTYTKNYASRKKSRLAAAIKKLG